MTESDPPFDDFLVVRALGDVAAGGRRLFRIIRGAQAGVEPESSVVSGPQEVLDIVEQWLGSLPDDPGPGAR
jgi:hypothetical protein